MESASQLKIKKVKKIKIPSERPRGRPRIHPKNETKPKYEKVGRPSLCVECKKAAIKLANHKYYTKVRDLVKLAKELNLEK